jgi:cytochrome c peroxidase
MDLFFSERLECFHCHGGFNFSDAVDHARLPEPERAFHNTGLYNVDGNGAYPPGDRGLLALTGNPADMGRFKAPTLRNIAVTAPYMHDGSIATLEEVIDHYAEGGRTIASGPDAGVGSASPLKDPFVSGFVLSDRERADLVAFLESLTDESFLTDPRFSDPFAAEERGTIIRHRERRRPALRLVRMTLPPFARRRMVPPGPSGARRSARY